MDQEPRIGGGDKSTGEGPGTTPPDEEKNAADYIKGLRRGYVLLVWLVVLAPVYPFLHLAMLLPFFMLPILIVATFTMGLSRLEKPPRTSGAGRNLARSAVALPVILVVSIVLFAVSLPRTGIGRYNTAGGNLLVSHLREYTAPHNGKLPPADQWCDVLLRNPGVGQRHFGYDGKSLLAINAWAYDVEGRLPEDMVLLFAAEPGWNQTGGPELARSSPRGWVRVFLANGSMLEVPEKYLPDLRWRVEDDGVLKLPDSMAGFAILSAAVWITVLAVVWTCRTRDRRVWMRAGVVGTASALAGALFGWMAEYYSYQWGGLDFGVFLAAGAPVGFAVGVAFVLLIARLDMRKAEGESVFGPATVLGGLTGIVSSCVIHGYMMIAYDNPAVPNMLLGQLFGLWAGVVLGAATSGMLGASQSKGRKAAVQAGDPHMRGVVNGGCNNRMA